MPGGRCSECAGSEPIGAGGGVGWTWVRAICLIYLRLASTLTQVGRTESPSVALAGMHKLQARLIVYALGR